MKTLSTVPFLQPDGWTRRTRPGAAWDSSLSPRVGHDHADRPGHRLLLDQPPAGLFEPAANVLGAVHVALTGDGQELASHQCRERRLSMSRVGPEVDQQ